MVSGNGSTIRRRAGPVLTVLGVVVLMVGLVTPPARAAARATTPNPDVCPAGGLKIDGIGADELPNGSYTVDGTTIVFESWFEQAPGYDDDHGTIHFEWEATALPEDTSIGQVLVKAGQEWYSFASTGTSGSASFVAPPWWSNISFCFGEIERGTLVVAKVLSGDLTGFDTASKFGFAVDCSVDAFDETFQLAGGEQRVITGLPFGTSCEVEETSTPPAGTLASWTTTYVDPDPDTGDGTITITGSASETVTVTNHRSVSGGNGGTIPPSIITVTGPLTIAKDVVGVPAAEVTDYRFSFAVDCSDDAYDGTAAISGEGSLLYATNIPVGATCTVREVGMFPERPGETWVVTVSDTDGDDDGTVTIRTGGETVGFTNARSLVAPTVVTTVPPTTAAPLPSVLPTAVERDLPRTGARTDGLAAVAGIALVLGGLLLMMAEHMQRLADEP